MRKTTIILFLLIYLMFQGLDSASALDYGIQGKYVSENGESYSFDRFIGKPVLVDATATWCEPCEDQIENLRAVYANHSDDIEFLTLSVSPISDSIQKMNELKSSTQAGWEFGVDSDYKFMNQFKVGSLPTIYLLDEFGHLEEKWVGLTSSTVVNRALSEYLQYGRIVSDSTSNGLSLITIVFLAATFGLLSALSPCLFPLFPNYVAVSMKRKSNLLSSVGSAVLLTAGILTVLLLFAWFASYTLTSFLIRNYFYFAIFQASILIISGIILVKTPSFIYNIKLPEKIENWIFSDDDSKNFYVLSYVLGLIFTIIAAPCASGYFLSVLAMSISKVFLEQTIILMSYSIGAGLPFLIFSVFNVKITGDTIGKIHWLNNRLSLFLGSILIIIGGWILITLN